MLVVKGNQGDLQKQAATSCRKFFPPQYQTVDQGHGRIEWRGIEVREVTPTQMGFPHVAQVARIDRIRELKSGRQEVETIWIITSLTATQADAARLLELVRQYWSIENGTHYPWMSAPGKTGAGSATPSPPRFWVFSVAPSKVKPAPGCVANPEPAIAPLPPSSPK